MKRTLVEIAIALVLAKLFGAVFERYKQPSVLGAILAGFLISVFIYACGRYDLIVLAGYDGEAYDLLARIGIIFLLFISGMETGISDIRKVGGEALAVAWLGVLIPFSLGFAVGYFIGFTLLESLVMGAILTATSVGITVRSLMDLNLLHTETSQVILNAAVIDDVIGIIIITLVLGGGNVVHLDPIGITIGPLEYLIIGIALFFLVALVIGARYIEKVMSLVSRVSTPKAVTSISIAICFVLAAIAQWVHLAEITGAFLAGLLIGKTIESRRISEDIRSIGSAFFMPLFFVGIGVSISFDSLWMVSLPVVMFIGVALLGKIVGCGLAARLSGLPGMSSVVVGIGMMPRMEVALVVVAAAMANPNFVAGGHSQEILVMTIMLVLVSTVLAPVMLKMATDEEDIV